MSKNLITNKSIDFLTNSLAKQANISSKTRPNSQRQVLILKGLNLSFNNLSSKALKYDMIKKKDREKWSQMLKLRKNKNEFSDIENELCIKYCSMKRFFSLMYNQIFIENIDFSSNEGLEESLIKYIDVKFGKYDILNDPLFLIEKIEGQNTNNLAHILNQSNNSGTNRLE